MVSLRVARTEQLLTMRELAERAHVAPSTIFLIEHGRCRPRLRIIRQIVEALGVEPRSIDEFRRVLDSLEQPPRTER